MRKIYLEILKEDTRILALIESVPALHTALQTTNNHHYINRILGLKGPQNLYSLHPTYLCTRCI